MKNSIKGFVYLCIITLFTACSFKPTSLEINQYAINFKLKENKFNNTLNELYIEEPSVNKSFNNRSIFYTTKAYQFEEYALNKWINKPSDMIYNNLFEAFEASNIYKTVLKEKRKDDFTYVLKTDVIDIYNSVENDKSYAVLKVKFYLQMNKENIKTYTYDKKIQALSNTPYGFIVAINEAFEEAVNEWILEISKLR